MKTQLKRVSATGGFLQNVAVEFKPGLNCIIGARGTCKSTLVESIRFAFNCDERKIADLTRESLRDDQAQGLIRASLPAGAIQCGVESQDAQGSWTAEIERELDASARVYREGVREHASSGLLDYIEIFSQGDLQRIAAEDQQAMRLELIDRPNRGVITEKRDARSLLIGRLKDIGPRIRQLNEQSTSLSREVNLLADMKQQLAGLQASRPTLPSDLAHHHKLALERKAILADISDAAEAWDGAQEYLSSSENTVQELSTVILRLERHKHPVADAAARKLAAYRAKFKDIDVLADYGSSLAVDEDVKRATAQFEQENEGYYQLRKEQQQTNESLKKEEVLRAQVEHLEALGVELEGIREEKAELVHERVTCRAQIDAISDEIYRLRLAEVNDINQKHSDVVVLTLKAGSQSALYQLCLSGLLAGSRIKQQDEVARDLATSLRPSELIDLVEESKAKEISEIVGRDIGQINRVVSQLGDHELLYTLEETIFDDSLDVTMYDNGKPKLVETLSKGQKATALLPLVLRPAQYPLIIDQPEDDLDNSFIYRSLVQVIAELKKERQIIFVTHNANIPVLGEAEQVIVMKMRTPEIAEQPKMGTVDHTKREILELLEGGQEAFERREARYAELLGTNR
jgi:ABC-type cobalamin/Fe3+-siderophores transport system ATPase subunit